ncbi:MAG: hypothetical protein IJI46_10900 [Erysipelotrichaceae bacterium]|nr:hypothetical protein [Erysipelotrichaceae bacterium]
MKRQKSYTWIFLVGVIVCSLFFMVFSSRQSNEEEVSEEPAKVLAEVSKPCEVKQHYKVYLGLGEVYVLDDIGYLSDDTNIATVSTNRVTGQSVGKTVLRKDCNTYEVEVTDLIVAPNVDNTKPFLSCGRYSEEENDYLDEILATKIAERGYQTRAAVVQAARFLTLQFPYRMNYFNENGRLPYCDGEGRYYHTGLYLNASRYDEVGKTVRGKATWGCPIYSVSVNVTLNNAFDCSGFVSWCLLNGGYDPGDLGAGPKPDVFDLADLGPRVRINEESLQNIKNGDLMSANGHIGILIGIKDDRYYIAETNYGINLRVIDYSPQELMKTSFTHYVAMDEYYGEDGKLNRFWE